MDEIENAARELTTSEQLVKAVLGAVAAFFAKKIVEDAVEAGFRLRNP